MFKPHCDYQISVTDNIMHCTMRGVWNVEGVWQYFDDIQRHAEPILDSPWIRIVDTTEFEGGGLALMDALKDIQEWSLAHKCKHLIIVAPRPLNKAILDQHQATYANMKYLYTMEEALTQAQALLSVD
ncbi:hypothetical protein DXX93_04985 [Thalassotalea euphylliae]|uniref:STAS domain-containing protein n=1 Tax=Thalassotalea euphylliae TaxID=1655234 RepID=A0A3E0TPI4_9GAMM|nr:hypothetical protein [Thalassotalea euphylliae]REL25982.1 hypothetical protein DXX93_04985 [Thalassotalea euphylliae]